MNRKLLIFFVSILVFFTSTAGAYIENGKITDDVYFQTSDQTGEKVVAEVTVLGKGARFQLESAADGKTEFVFDPDTGYYKNAANGTCLIPIELYAKPDISAYELDDCATGAYIDSGILFPKEPQ